MRLITNTFLSTFRNLRKKYIFRKVTTRAESEFIENLLPWSRGFSIKDLRDRQCKDPDLQILAEWLERGKRPDGHEASSASPVTRHYLQFWDNLEVKQGIIFRNFRKRDGSGTHLQFLTPVSMRKEVLKQMHDTLLGGHLGTKKCCEKLLQRFYWFRCREDVNLWIMQCRVCGANNTPPKKPRAPLGSMLVGAPLDRLCTDLMGPFPKTPRGNRHILVVTDSFSKWVEVFAVPDQSAPTCANVILNEVIARYGCPLDIHSDQGSCYESIIFAELCKLLEIRKTRTSPGNPKCNGQTERFNKTLVRMIRAYLKDQQTDWDLNLGCLAAAYRATPHESTGLTPNLVMLGREVWLPAEIIYGSRTAQLGEEVSSYGAYVDKLKERLQTSQELARKHLKAAAERQKNNYDAKQALNSYKEGDLVWCLQDYWKDRDVCIKLQMPYDGPFLVVKKMNDLNYQIQFNARGRRKIMHHDKLKLYTDQEDPPEWIRSEIKKMKPNTTSLLINPGGEGCWILHYLNIGDVT